MGLSTPRTDSIEIIAFRPVKELRGIKPMGLSDHKDDSIDIINFQTVTKLWGINIMVLSAPRDESEPPIMIYMLDITSIYSGVNELVTNRQNTDIKHT